MRGEYTAKRNFGISARLKKCRELTVNRKRQYRMKSGTVFLHAMNWLILRISGLNHLFVPMERLHRNTLAGRKVNIDKAKAFSIAAASLEVIRQRPLEISTDICSVFDGTALASSLVSAQSGKCPGQTGSGNRWCVKAQSVSDTANVAARADFGCQTQIYHLGIAGKPFFQMPWVWEKISQTDAPTSSAWL